jgi:hypothetical protein
MAGDAAAAQELQKHAARMQEFATKSQEIGKNFTPEQMQRAAKLAEKAMSAIK